MKGRIIVVIILCVIVCIIGAVGIGMAQHDDYLRIHIRANSNSEVDQDVKYMVKGEIVKLLSPLLEDVKTADEAKAIVLANMDNINNVANKVLYENGFDYTASADVHREKFPERHYGNLTLEAGVYDALIVNLGTGEGDNWWCVVFPPLCFVRSEEVGDGNFHYVSKIAEIIAKIKGDS